MGFAILPMKSYKEYFVSSVIDKHTYDNADGPAIESECDGSPKLCSLWGNATSLAPKSSNWIRGSVLQKKNVCRN